MATIKAYTDLEQSKKLAEILPLESADMVYQSVEDEYGDGEWEAIPRNNSLNIGYDDDIPCWSLAALLEVLPDELEDNHFLSLDKEGDAYWCCYEDVNGNSFTHIFADNSIDACVAMIEKLHEVKLL